MCIRDRFLLFLYAGTRIAQSSPDNFGTMVAGGCTIMIAFQAFLNIAMVIGWFPVAVSYTHLLACAFGDEPSGEDR